MTYSVGSKRVMTIGRFEDWNQFHPANRVNAE